MLILRPPWDSQPQEAAELNTGDPVCEGLLVAAHPPNGLFADLVSRRALSPSGVTLGVGPAGRAFTYAGAGTLDATISTPTLWSMVVVCDASSLAGNKGLFGFGISGGAYAVICRTESGVLKIYQHAAVDRVAVGPTLTTGRVYVISADWNGSTLSLYVDGRLVASNGSVSTIRSANQLRFGGVTEGTERWTGNIYEAFYWDRSRPAEHHAATGQNTWPLFEPRRVYIPLSTTSGAYTLNLETGIYSFTGSAATLIKDSKLTLDSGTYTLSGSNASLLKGLILEASSGSYSLTGSDASLFYTHLLNASSGSYSVTGSDATLTYTPTSGAYTLNLESGAYVLLGQDVTFVYSGSEVTLKAGSWIRYRIIT